MEDEDIRALVKRLARPHGADGGAVIERAAILAEAADFTSVIAWIANHDGQPEAPLPVSTRGLHGSRVSDRGADQRRPPLRYVLPGGSLN